MRGFRHTLTIISRQRPARREIIVTVSRGSLVECAPDVLDEDECSLRAVMRRFTGGIIRRVVGGKNGDFPVPAVLARRAPETVDSSL